MDAMIVTTLELLTTIDKHVNASVQILVLVLTLTNHGLTTLHVDANALIRFHVISKDNTTTGRLATAHADQNAVLQEVSSTQAHAHVRRFVIKLVVSKDITGIHLNVPVFLSAVTL